MESVLFIIIKKIYFDQICSGIKIEEYRIVNEFWKKKLDGKTYTHILFQVGYSKKERAKVEWLGVERKKMKVDIYSHESIDVYAIRLGTVIKL